MVEDAKNKLTLYDGFAPIANHYDEMMAHVDYDRWLLVTTALGDMLRPPFRHLEAGCGTGVLLKRLRDYGWDSIGLDLSPAMLHVAKNRHHLSDLVRGTFCVLPFSHSFDLATCLFDSLNFLLTEEAFAQAMESFYQVLRPGGIFYFDVVTERMICDHFEDTVWTEDHGKFRSSWVSAYARQTNTCETRVRINSGEESITYERIYTTKFILNTLEQAGFTLLAIRDANTWKAPTKRTTRIDFMAVKGDAGQYRQAFKAAEKKIKIG